MYSINITVNGEEKTLAFDLMDVECAGRLETAHQALMADWTAAQNLLTAAQNPAKKSTQGLKDTLIKQCTLITEFFDACVGAGTSMYLFGEEVNVRTIGGAFKDFMKAANDQKVDFGDVLS